MPWHVSRKLATAGSAVDGAGAAVDGSGAAVDGAGVAVDGSGVAVDGAEVAGEVGGADVSAPAGFIRRRVLDVKDSLDVRL